MSDTPRSNDESDHATRGRNRQQAEKLLADFRRGDPTAIEVFRTRHPRGQDPDFQPHLIDARIIIVSDRAQVRPLSLPGLKKQAKRLLKAWRTGDGDGPARAARVFAPGRLPAPANARLADAQFIIARENGLPSWPRLKAHLQALEQADRALNRPGPVAADQGRAHIRCGSDIALALPAAGLTGPFFNFEEIYICGPLTGGADADPAPFLKRRAAFLSTSFTDAPGEPDRDMSVDGVLASLKRDRQQIETLCRNSPSLCLWFEHDAHDQFMLAALLHLLAENSWGRDVPLHMVSPDRFPGVDRFMGLGQLSGHPAGLRLLWEQRTTLTATQKTAGADVWRAACDPSPMGLWAGVQTPDHPLHHMPAALRWHLMQLPAISDGLSDVERRILQVAAADGTLTPGRIFALHMYEADPLPTLGDLVFFNILDGLVNADRPALEYISFDPAEPPHRRGELALTDMGRALLAGDVDWLDLNPVDRWVGGVHVCSGQRNWRWDSRQGPVFDGSA